MENEVVLHNGLWWPIKDGSEPITEEYAHNLSTCYQLMNVYPNIPENICKFVEKKNVVVQAGGNVGFYVNKYAQWFKHVYTFEPDPINFYCLNLNCTSTNVHKFQACLGNDHKCVNVFNTNETLGHGGSHVTGEGTTPTLKIDDLNLNECDLIHLDIEGYEKFAILGGISTIKRCRPVIVVEDYPPWKIRYNSSINEIEQILYNIGYEFVSKVEGDTDRIYKFIDKNHFNNVFSMGLFSKN
jgi:FkbM family methyltransferase